MNTDLEKYGTLLRTPYMHNDSARRRRKQQKTIFQEIMSENYPNLTENNLLMQDKFKKIHTQIHTKNVER